MLFGSKKVFIERGRAGAEFNEAGIMVSKEDKHSL